MSNPYPHLLAPLDLLRSIKHVKSRRIPQPLLQERG